MDGDVLALLVRRECRLCGEHRIRPEDRREQGHGGREGDIDRLKADMQDPAIEAALERAVPTL
jgi:hypothetical protein